MYLKSIEVYGFKSFANKILFKFNNGITGIVGPNGSGKSNVGDAVRWVLGEQSAKQLRGSKMEDVIFSGTELRKPQGSAYVAITLDNSDHSLPLDYNEVTVARRVYRSGESEYLINGVVSRLKDVQRLFFDTGIGKEGYSIIGQGQIEKILSGKPEERRELFDEAAGIVKYKKNKIATERSLENERQNLSRVSDILKELEKQVGPLKDQSETARRYLIFRDEMKKLDVNSFLLDVDKTKEQLKDYENKLMIVEDDSTRLRGEFDLAKEEYDKIETLIEQINNDIDTTRNEIHEKKLINQKLEGEVSVTNQQIISFDQTKAGVIEQLDKQKADLVKYKQEIDKLFEEKSVMDEKLDNADDVLDDANSEFSIIEENIVSTEERIESLKSEIIEFLNEGGTLKAKVGRYDTMLENIGLRKTQLNQKFLEIKSDEEKYNNEKELLTKALSDVSAELEKMTSRRSLIESELDSNLSMHNSLKTDISRYNDDIVSLKSKKEALRNLTERYDGYGNSIRRVMDQKSHETGIIGVVADIISVDKQYETAIETALGGSIQNIVTEDDDTAKRMISFLKNNKYGRATFLPISSIVDRTSQSSDIHNEKGYIGVASTLVKADSKFNKIIIHLLGRIIVIDNIDNAMLISRKYKQSLRIVTLDGEQINPGGALTGGAFRNSSNLLGRKRELDEITEEVTKLSEKLNTTIIKRNELSTQREKLKSDKDSIIEMIQQLNIKNNTYKLNLKQTDDMLAGISKSFSSIKFENDELSDQINQINSNKEELYNNSRIQEDSIKENEKTITELEKEVEKLKSDRTSAQEKINTLNLEFNTVKQKYDFILQNIKRIREDEKNGNENLKILSEKLNSGNDEVAKLTESISQIKTVLDENNRIILLKEQKLAELIDRKTVTSDNHKEFFDKREKLSQEINGLDKSAYAINASIEKLSDKSESLNNYMWEEYELTYNLATEFKDEEYKDIASLKHELSAVKSKIKALGEVNVSAIEQYKEVSERYEFLKSQHDDIIKAEQNLVNIISELDRAMREQFAEKFKDIRIMFAKVFKELFGGGKADLELVDEEDILETGIRIIAQPPGKKLQNMMQLSGGEKSLTAIALLFAIQSLKPSPFCLLDEIEAALDDSNVKRFAKYLNKLTKDTQFIVITHRKGTMEAADVLYGITMQEKGVSTLVSVNMIESELDE